MGLISFIKDKFVLRGQSSELGDVHYDGISLSYTHARSIFNRAYNVCFDTSVWAHDFDEALERAKEKWVEQEKYLKAKGITDRVKVSRSGMYHDSD